jgi:hypothetical protein
MPRFLIEIQHANDYEGCIKALQALMRSGSHLISQAEFGCEDGIHCGWLIAELDSREDAHRMVPPQFRADTRVIQLRRWTPKEMEAMASRIGA